LTEVTIRPATDADVARIAEIMHGEPRREALGLIGDVDLARKFGTGLVLLDHIPNAAKPTVVATRDDDVVGVLQYTCGQSDRTTFAHVRLAFRVFGPLGVVRRIPRLRARSSVEIPIPAGSFCIAEVHVDPQCRGHGIGGALLDWAESEAKRLGATKMTLTTHTENPARRLYERKGFTVTRTVMNTRYEKYTGIPGRLLMEKPIG
jgi:ribosomal protein S18 acetylase RimI-like enzyme